MPEIPLPAFSFTPALWVALAVLVVALVTTFMLAATDLVEAVRGRTWLNAVAFLLAMLAASAAVIYLAVQLGLLSHPPGQ